uniref:Eukaryotic translation initiation factor 4 gamma 1 n=1 Tax=Lygus hesperus TaxID=30085 RepID=A0A0A9W4H4_LYGHE
MAPINKFYSIRPGESLEELKRKRGLSLCELLDELDRIEDENEEQDNLPVRELNFENLSDEDRQAQDQLKRLRGALNKLAPDNFYVQLMEIQDNVPAHNNHLMKLFVKQLVEKAIDEECYSLLYAHVCKALQNIELLEVEDETVYNFGGVVLEECYNKFCYNRSSSNWWSPNEPTESEVIELEAKEGRKRKKLVGIMRFIGDLYKSGMIDVKDVFRYVKKLEQEDNEKCIESLCKLLTTAGKELETAVLQTEFESDWYSVWERILELSNKERGLPLRQRFLLMNLLDLMNGGWVPRLPPVAPKTYVEIVAENQTLHEKNEPAQKVEKAVTESVISNEPTVVATEQEILKFLKSGQDVYTHISNWEIENYKGRKTWFIYAMTRAVLRFCVVGNTLDNQRFAELIKLLQKYINSRQAEVACMYGVQYIIVAEKGNPKGLLEHVCEMLHQTHTVSYIAFLDWRENWSKSPVLEVQGKADAQITLATFFIKLFWESIRPSSRYKSIVKELNSFDLEHLVSMAKLPPEIGKRIKMEEEREQSELNRRERDDNFAFTLSSNAH